jgi:uncharacterized protein (DUF433 family)
MKMLLERISIDPAVCGGKPCVSSTRIWVSLILDFLADGMVETELLAEYPQLAHEDVLLRSHTGRKLHTSGSCQFRPVGSREVQAFRRH